MLAQAAASAQQLDDGSTSRLNLICMSISDYDAYADATLVYCFNMCLDKPFLRRMETLLLAQLQLGACVLLHGQGFPEPDANGGTAARCGGRRLQLALRMRMWYGYQVVAVADGGVSVAANSRHAATAQDGVRGGMGGGNHGHPDNGESTTPHSPISRLSASLRVASSQSVLRPQLKRGFLPLGTSRFERAVLVAET